jgi:DNA polymerase-4
MGAGEAMRFLALKPVGFIWGVGKQSAARLRRDGFGTVADLQRADESDLMRRYGVEGRRLWRLSRGIDARGVNPDRETKSVSAETTFNEDIAAFKPLEKILWSLSERVSARLKAKGIAGATVTLKLKTADFRIKTRARSLGEPTVLAARIFAAGRDLLARETDGTRYRLIGIGLSQLSEADKADAADLVDLRATRTAKAEHAVDKVREKFGRAAVVKGLVFDGTKPADDEEDDD